MPASPGSPRAADESRVASCVLPCSSAARSCGQNALATADAKGGTMRFAEKVAVVTAFANGIGRATAEIMAREGATVIGVDNHQGRLEEAVAALRDAGGKAHGRLCDALDQAQVEATVAGVEQEFGAIDILVNAVGGSTI